MMKQAMIFAAGLGTRLRPLTDTMPKALVPVGGQPLIYHVIHRLKAEGFQRIVVNVHHFADQIISYLQTNQFFGLDIRISDERNELLETGGGIRKALPLFDEQSPVLIHNVDILSNAPLARIYNKVGEHDALLLVSPRETSRYLLFRPETLRLVGWQNIKTGEVKGAAVLKELRSEGSGGAKELWSERSERSEEKGGIERYAFSGIHVLSPTLLQRMKDWPARFPIIDFYLQECPTADIIAFPMADLRLIDVGKLSTLDQAEEFLRQG